MKLKPIVAGAAGFYVTRGIVDRRKDALRAAVLAAQDESGGGSTAYREASDRYFRFEKLAGVLPWIVSIGVSIMAPRLLR